MKQIKQLFNYFSYIPALFRILWRVDKVYMLMTIGEMLSFTFLAYPPLILVKYTFDALQNEVTFSDYTVIVIGILVLILFTNILKTYFNDNIRINRGGLMQGRLTADFYKKCMELDYELLAEKETLELKDLARQFVSFRFGNTVWSFIAMFSNIIALISAIIILTAINPLVIAVTVGGIVINSIISAFFIKLNHPIDEELTIRQREINYFNGTASDFAYGKDIRIFNMSGKIEKKIQSAFFEIYKIFKKKKTYSDYNGLINSFLQNLIQFVVYILLGYSVIFNGFSLGSFSLAIGTIGLLRNSLGGISGTLLYYSDSIRYIKYYIDFMGFENKFEKTGIIPLSVNKDDDYTIEFKNVSFKYPGQSEYALKNFNIKIYKGEKISIVGENGAGKSTFIKLLTRLYDPTEGEILLNSVNIKDINYSEYLSVFSSVFQDFQLFAFTMGENITSLTQTDKTNITQAAEKAGIHNRITELPNQYDTYLFKLFDEDGVELSGGEQQKLAIARAYFKDTAFVTILDEPTSALDPRAEYLLYNQFNDLIGDKTAFYISHRLSSSKFCDKIMVIEHGMLKEYGVHQELMNLNGSYSQMYTMQASYYE
jgi:ABC-type multidrug transport system, ATPase and permease components